MSTLFSISQTDKNPYFNGYGPEGQGFESLTACQKKSLESQRVQGFLVFYGCCKIRDFWLWAHKWAHKMSDFSFDLNPFQRLERVDFLWQEYEQIRKTEKSSLLSSSLVLEGTKMETKSGSTQHGFPHQMSLHREQCRWQKQELDGGKRKSALNIKTVLTRISRKHEIRHKKQTSLPL